MSLNHVVAVTIDPSVERGALAAVDFLRKTGWRTQLIIEGSSAGSSLDQTILQDGSIQAVLDFSLNELAAIQTGNRIASLPERLTSASRFGLPMVIVPGAVDHVVEHRPIAPVPRNSHKIDDHTLLLRTTPTENDAIGKEIAFKASASSGQVTIVFPRGGLSHWDAEGMPMWDHQADSTLLDSLHLWKAPNIELIESHRHINDPLFAQIAVDQLLKLLVVRR